MSLREMMRSIVTMLSRIKGPPNCWLIYEDRDRNFRLSCGLSVLYPIVLYIYILAQLTSLNLGMSIDINLVLILCPHIYTWPYILNCTADFYTCF